MVVIPFPGPQLRPSIDAKTPMFVPSFISDWVILMVSPHSFSFTFQT